MSQKIKGQTKYYFWWKRLTSEKNEHIENSVAGWGSFYMNYCNAEAHVASGLSALLFQVPLMFVLALRLQKRDD